MKNIVDILNETNALVTPALEEILKTPSSELEPLYSAMRYSALSGGKRIRPLLVFEFCKLFGGEEKNALPLACAIELVHASSLVHDDMPCMDNDDYRRGRLTCHKVYGEDIALLCGDALITKGYEMAANSGLAPSEAIEAVKLLLSMAGGEGMMGGQNVDLSSEGKSISFEMLLRMHEMKTGALIRAAAGLGCISAHVMPGDERFLSAVTYAEKIGLAFQIIDDVLDVTGDAADLGKNVHADAALQKTTFISFMSVEDAREYAKKVTDEAIFAIKCYENSDELCRLAEFLLSRNK